MESARGCVAFATSCDLTEDVQVKADKSMIFGRNRVSNSTPIRFTRPCPTLKNGFMQDKMCDVGAVSNTDTFIKQGAYNTETATSWSWGALKNVNYFIDGCNDPKYCTVEAETQRQLPRHRPLVPCVVLLRQADHLRRSSLVPQRHPVLPERRDVQGPRQPRRDHPQPDRRPRFRLRAHPGHLVDRQRDAHALGRPPRSSRASASSKRLTAVTTTSRGLR